MANDWSMPRPGEACFGTGREFEIGEEFQVFLYEADEGYERRDYSLDFTPPAEPAPVATWRTRRPEPSTKKAPPFDREAIYGFFERLEDAKDPIQAQFRFVLSLLLWRKKVLKLDRSATEGEQEIWEYTAIGTGVSHRVPRPALDEDRLETLSTQLEHLLANQPGQVNIDMPADLPLEANHE